MSATDVTDGNGEEAARGGDNADEAAWLELIGRFDAPAGFPGTPVPWPERENLAPSGPPGESSGRSAAEGRLGESESTAWTAQAGGESAARAKADGDGPAAGAAARWPATDGTDRLTTGEDTSDDGLAGPGLLPGADLAAGGRFGLPGHRPANPRSWSVPDDDDDGEHFTPPPPPPLPTLPPGTKAAWTGLFGGPAYLLTATLADWSVPAWALFLAIAAFVGGFTVLVLRQGDRQDSDDDPGDGAVV